VLDDLGGVRFNMRFPFMQGDTKNSISVLHGKQFYLKNDTFAWGVQVAAALADR
jgi:hypothetical protein